MNNVLAGRFVAIIDAAGREMSERVPITANEVRVVRSGSGLWLAVFASMEAKDYLYKTLIEVDSLAHGDAVSFSNLNAALSEL